MNTAGPGALGIRRIRWRADRGPTLAASVGPNGNAGGACDQQVESPKRSFSSAERQGAYGPLESNAVGSEEIGTAVFEACGRRSAGESYVVCPIDGTSLTLTDGDRRKDFGPIGSRAEGARGLKVINAMVLSADGVPLGVSSQQWWVRSDQRRSQHRDELRPDQKETRHWLAAMEQTRRVMAKCAPSTRCWFQLDREADAWPMLSGAGLDGHWFTIRAHHRRRVLRPSGRSDLHTVLAQQSVKNQVPAGGKSGCATAGTDRDDGGARLQSDS